MLRTVEVLTLHISMYAPFDCNLSAELLLGCLDVVPDIQNKTSALLEAWWQGVRESREEMVPNTILYLVARTLDDGAKVREGGRGEGGRGEGGGEGGRREREGREEMVPTTILYLVARTLDNGAKVREGGRGEKEKEIV